MTKAQFKQILASSTMGQWKDDTMLERLFVAFDTEKTGSINFGEFIMGLSALSEGNMRDKITLAFKVYDVEGNGAVSKQEMTQILTSTASAHGVEQKAEEVSAFVDKVFLANDLEQNGLLSFPEYLNAVMKHPSLVHFKMEESKAGEQAAEPVTDFGKLQHKWLNDGISKGYVKAGKAHGTFVLTTAPPG